MARLEDKVTLITGSASGIGRRAAERFVEEGAVVVVADRDLAAADAVAARLGTRASAVGVDVADSASVARAVDSVVTSHGRLDVLVNNAGVTIVGAVRDLAEEDWDREMAVNLKGVFLCSRRAWDHLGAVGGCIVNTASIAATMALVADAAYCASKAAVLMLTKCMALDGARAGIRVNAVCPGFVDTPMIEGFFRDQDDPEAARRLATAQHPLGRLGDPLDIADAMVYLASDEARWVTGAAMTVDGGLTAGLWGPG
jgi:NAD(P)-dependent dehydrogenase (short-subunit alcohol dehydrogenase family)